MSHHILLVEDDVMIASGLVYALEKEGYIPTHCRDVRSAYEAIHAIQTNPTKSTNPTKLFKRFEYSQNENGYGIGLPLARSIVRGQNGDMEIQGGGHGTGATFTIKFYLECE